MRGRYMQRLFATAAMKEHLENPEAFREGVPPPDVGAALRRQLGELGPLSLFLIASLIFVTFVACVCAVSESATMKVGEMILGPLLG